MRPEHLKNYNVKNVSAFDLLINWPFDKMCTQFLFFHGIKVHSLKDFLCENTFLSDFFIVKNDIYYLKNGELLNLITVSYPNLVASAIYAILTESEKNNSLERDSSDWKTILDYLLCPLFHKEILSVLERGTFFEQIPLQIIESFLYKINRLINITENRYFYFYPESKNAVFFYNILRYIGISNKESLALAENCIATNDLNEIRSYLQDLYETKKKIF